MSKYYPEFYLKRRQKHLAYMRVTVTTVVLAVIALGVMAGVYFFNSFIAPRRTDIRPNRVMADEKTRLQDQVKLDNSQPAVGADASQTVAEASKLNTSELAYSQSYPAISVGLAGLEAGQAEPASGLEDAAGLPEGTTLPGSEPVSGEASAPSPAGANRDAGASDAAPPVVKDSAEAEKPASKPQGSTTKPPSKPSETSKTESNKQKDSPAKKPEASSEASKPPKEVKPAAESTGAVEFKVYAGKFLSREDAEKGKKELAGVGFSGTIIDTKAGDFVLLVGSVDDYEKASALKSKLSESGFGGSFVTRKKK